MTAASWDDPLALPTALRAVGAGDYPYPGVVRAGVPPRLWADAGAFAASPVWHADPDGHLLAPLDVARTPEGHAVLLPLCSDRLRVRLERDAPLTAGEAVNIAVSLVRGGAEAQRLELDVGTWWITDDGRPVLAAVGRAGWRDETAALLRCAAIDQDRPLAAALEAAAALVLEPRRPPRRWQECEDALLAVAAPVALEPRRTPQPARRAVVAPAPEPDTADVAGGVVAALVDRVGRAFDGDLAQRVRDSLSRRHDPAPRRRVALTAARRAAGADEADPPQRSRRMPVLAGAAVAAAVLVGGFLWPDDEPTAAQPGPSPSASVSGPVAEPAIPSASASSAPLTPEAVAAALLDHLAECTAAGVDCAHVHEDPARPVPAGVATGPADARELSLLDEYGGVTVLRASSTDDDVPEQIVVIVRDGEGWLVRDIYDIADQP